MDTVIAECGNSYFDWYANGCQYGADPLDMCQKCTEWESEYWGGVEHVENGDGN